MKIKFRNSWVNTSTGKHWALSLVGSKNKLLLYVIHRHLFSILNIVNFVKETKLDVIVIRAYIYVEKLCGTFPVVHFNCLFLNCLNSSWSFSLDPELPQYRHCVYQTQLRVWTTMGGHCMCVDFLSKNNSSDVGD